MKNILNYSDKIRLDYFFFKSIVTVSYHNKLVRQELSVY